MNTPPEPNGERIGSKELQKIVDDFVSKGKKQEQLKAREEIVKKANQVTIQVQQHFMAAHPNLNLIPTKAEQARDEIYDLYRGHYLSWTRDELIENLSMIQACYHVESIRDHLI